MATWFKVEKIVDNVNEIKVVICIRIIAKLIVTIA